MNTTHLDADAIDRLERLAASRAGHAVPVSAALDMTFSTSADSHRWATPVTEVIDL